MAYTVQETGKEITVSLAQLFHKLVVLLWLPQLQQRIEAQPCEVHHAGDQAMGEAQKKRKRDSAHAAAKQQRTHALPELHRLNLLTLCEGQRRSGGRSGQQQPEQKFEFFLCPTDNQGREAAREQWSAAGKEAIFELFHPPKMKQPFRFKRHV